MDCGACGRSNRPGAMFCGGCGSALTSRCSKCDAELEPDLAFCDRCGTRVSGEATAPAFTPAAPDTAVRKTVTVLFADLGGSTSFGERTDAELAREVMARYHAILQAVIDAHGGTVAKFMGDGMMATFGIPEIAEDDATRAIHAGTELQRRFHEFAAEVADRHGESLTLRVGINTGEVVIADGDADLIGDALNVAARLEKACRPGHVLVGEETWRITRGEFGFEPLGQVAVAGRAQPVTIYEVAEAEAATAEPVAPFVGRALEMQRLHTVFDRAASSRTAMLVTVLGSPGLGKTRLSRELAHRLAADSSATTFEIRCDREGEATFAPIAQLIREAADIGDDTEAEAAGARDRIAALFPAGDADRERLVDVLAGVFGAAPARSVEETFWSIRRLVEVLASTRPLLVVIDDIQWAEPKLLDLLEHLAEWISDAAVLLLCLARPELREVRPALSETGRRVADVLALDGLDSAATEELAAGLLGTERLPAGLIERLPTSTDGNPLFVRELVRMLVDDEVIRRRESGEWELTIDADAVEVPPTIQSLLAARVERLPADERRLLELASVIGAEFSLGALRELAGAAVAVPPLLEGMRRKELVEPTGTYWGDEPVHRFHHVLIRDAAYRRLLKTARADLHQRVGEWTDASAANLIGEHEAAIAYHYEQAYAYRRELGTIDADTERVGRRAAELLSIAAQRALGRDDLASAGALSRRAVAVIPTDDLATRAELLLIACECFLASGDVAAGAPLVHELSEISAGDEKLAAWAVCFEAQLVSLTDPQGLLAADAAATAAATTLQALGDGAGEAKAHQVRAALLARLGRVGDAEAVLDLALGAARAANDRRRVTAVLGAAPVAALFGPSPVARAGGRCLDVVRLLRITTASPSVEATSMRCQAVLEALRGRFDVSRSMLAAARASLAELGLRHGLLETDLFTGMVELLAGDPGAAIAPLRAAYEGLGTLGVGADAGQAAALLARALLEQCDVDDADRMATASEELAGQNLKTAIAWRVARAEVLAARDNVADAVVLADEAVQIAAATDLILDHADACVALARLRESAGDLRGSAASRADAQHLYELKGATEPLHRLRGSEPAAEQTSTRATDPAAAHRPGAAGSRSPYAENASATTLERGWRLIVAGQLDEFAVLSTDDAALIDRRSVVAEDLHGREHILASARAFVDLGMDGAHAEVLAVRGSKLTLARVTLGFGNTSEIVTLQVLELDDNGLACRYVFFDEHDLDAAINELDLRYAAGEGAEHRDLLRQIVAFYRAARLEHGDGARDLMAPGFEYVDHRPLGFGRGDRDYFVTGMRSFGAVGMTDATEIDRTLHVSGRALLVVQTVVRTTEQAREYEWTDSTLLALDASGRVLRVEHFALDDWDLALARLDELGSGEIDTPSPRNSAVRQAERLVARFNARDFDGARLLIGNDFARFDRRHGVSAPTADGADAYMEAARAWFDVGFDELVLEPLAVRGESLMLSRGGYRAADGREVMFLVVYELDRDDLIARGTHFDEDGLVAAHTELDTRYFTGEAAAYAEIALVAARFAAASRRDDFDAMRELMTPDFVLVDHRPLGYGEGDGEYFIDLSRTRTQVSANGIQVARTIVCERNALLIVGEENRIATHGGEYGSVLCMVQVVDASHQLSRIEWFLEEEYERALARLHELAAAPPAAMPTLDNTATAALRRVTAIAERNDLGEIESLCAELCAEEIERLDHRGGVAGMPLRGRAEIVRLFHETFTVFPTFTAQPIAVRGERLALARVQMASPEGFEIRLVGLYELDSDGRLAFFAHYDESDLPAALNELDVRYVVTECPRHADWLQVCGAFAQAMAREDFEAARALMSADFVMRDHQSLGFGEGDADYYIEASRSRRLVAADGIDVNTTMEVAQHAVFTTLVSTFVTAESSEYERGGCYVLTVDPSHRINRFERFSDDQYSEARARFHELAAPMVPEIENAASRSVRALAQRNAAGDIDAAAKRYIGENYEHVSFRTVVASEGFHSRDAYIEGIRTLFELFPLIGLETIAVRGDRLCLTRSTLGTHSGFEMTTLGINEMDAAGMLVYWSSFDEDDLAAALNELDERYIAGEGAEHAYVIRRTRDHRRSETSADALRALYAPDAIVRNNRRLGWPMTTVEDVIERLSSDDGIADSTYLYPWVDCRADAMLSRIEQRLTTLEGNQYAVSFWSVQHWTAGLIDHLEFFELEDFDTARSCFEALAREPRTPHVDNAAVRMTVRGEWLARRGDAAAIEQLAPDVVEIDHRRGVSAPDIVGIGAYVENQRAVRGLIGSARIEHLAVRGERLVLARVAYTSREQFEATHLALFEYDDAGRLCRTDIWDDDDLLVAIDAMESRHRELAGEALSAFERLAASDRAGFVNDQMRTLTEVAPDAVFMPTKIYSTGPVGVFRGRVLGSTTEGDAYEWAQLLVVRLDDDGRAVRHEAFPEGRWTEALALFDEWVGSIA